MKHQYIQHKDAFMEQICIFEPANAAQRMSLNEAHTTLIFETASAGTATWDFTKIVPLRGPFEVVHAEPLSKLCPGNEAHFLSIAQKAQQYGYTLSNTFVYESLNASTRKLFPYHDSELSAVLKRETTPWETYAKLFSIGSLAEYVENYFRKHLGPETFSEIRDLYLLQPHGTPFAACLNAMLEQKKHAYEPE